MVVVLFGLDYFINSVLSLYLYFTHTLFDNKFELVICNLEGLNVHRCFIHILNIQLVSERVHLL